MQSPLRGCNERAMDLIVYICVCVAGMEINEEGNDAAELPVIARRNHKEREGDGAERRETRDKM